MLWSFQITGHLTNIARSFFIWREEWDSIALPSILNFSEVRLKLVRCGEELVCLAHKCQERGLEIWVLSNMKWDKVIQISLGGNNIYPVLSDMFLILNNNSLLIVDPGRNSNRGEFQFYDVRSTKLLAKSCSEGLYNIFPLAPTLYTIQ
ncbi:hypothetical protein AMTRI_Chr05g57850 [Amborella trichopoda]